MANNNNTKNLNVPTLRFPEFKGEWKKKHLSELVGDIKDRISTSSLSVDNYVSTENILQNFQGVTLATSLPHNTNVTAFRKDDILFSNIRPYLKKIWYASYDGGCSTDVFVFRNSGICSAMFLYHLIANDKFINYVMLGTKGTKMPRGDKQQIIQYVVYLPSKLEQNKIATFLSLLDSRIEAQIKIIEDLKLLKKELLKKVFFQELRLPEFNENWKIVTLSDVGTFFSGGTPSTSIGQYYNGNIPFIKSGEINADNTEQFISEEGLRNSSAKMVEIGDLIYALYGATSGEVGISKIKGAINQAILCIRTNLNSIFLLNFLMFKKEEILRTYLQGGQGNLSAEIIKSLKIPAPVYAEQTKLSHLFSAFDKKIELETNVMTKFMQQKQYLLANLFI